MAQADGTAEPGSDFFSSLSRRGQALVGQEMFKVLDRARELEKNGTRVYHLELGNPRQPPLPAVIEGAVSGLRRLNIGYTSSSGLPALRQAIAEHHLRLGCTGIGAANVVISPANLIINQFLDLVCNPGDRVGLFVPGFPTYWAATAHIGLEVTPVFLDPGRGYTLEPEAVEQVLAARPRAIIVNSANNPTGAVYREEVLRDLAERCHRAGIWLLSDETYADLCYSGPFFSLASLNLPNVVVMSSFSKVLSIPGYRTGYALASAAMAERFSLSNSTLISCLPIFTQEGCLAGMAGLDDYTRQLRQRFGRISARCAERINTSGVLRCVAPGSGFYLFVNIGDTGLEDMEFCTRLLESHHTAVTPGRSFGPGCTRHIRVAFCGNLEDVWEGVERVIALARQYG